MNLLNTFRKDLGERKIIIDCDSLSDLESIKALALDNLV